VCELEVLTPEALEQRALREFDDRVEQYVTLHRRLVRSLPPDQVFDDDEGMGDAPDLLAEAIRAARPDARTGNIFTVAPAAAFRQIIARTRLHGAPVWPTVPPPYGELLERLKQPVVHGAFLGPDAIIPATLLVALPPLPRELAYHIVQNDLVLVDTYANIIVDVLEDAFSQVGS
jgi:hypothetical protein